jgi:ADP-ribosylglycohydrolase
LSSLNVAPPPEGVTKLEDRFAGCLVGLAIGDALGMPFEGMDPQAILAGRSQVTEFPPGDGLASGQYTDDTKRTPPDFVTTVSSAVLGGGDTDTTAAVAGAISGTHNGLHRLPAHLVAQVEDSKKLQDLGRAIFRMAGTYRER